MKKVSVNYQYVLYALFVLCIIRCFFGFDWSDEIYYSALSYRISIGDTMFASIWDAMQLTGFLTFPFVSLFRFITGDTTGLMLFLRIIYTVFQLAVSLYLFKKIRKDKHDFIAFCIAALCFVAPNSIRTINYKSIVDLIIPIMLFQIMKATQSVSRKAAFLTGLCMSICVFSYPSTIIMTLFVLFWWLFIKNYRQYVLPYIAGGVSFILVFLMFIFFNSSMDNILRFSPYMIGSQEYSYLMTPTAKVFGYIKGFYHSFGSGPFRICYLFFLSFFSAYLIIKKNTSKTDQLFALIITVLTFVLVCLNLINKSPVFAYLNIISLLIIIAREHLCFPIETRILLCLGILYSLAIQLLSDMGPQSSFHPFIFILMGLLLCIHESNVPKTHYLSIQKYLICYATLLCVFFNIYNVYRDVPVLQAKYRLNSGIGWGLMTNKQSYDDYVMITKDLDSMNLKNESLLVSDLMPFAYFYSDVFPGTPSVWRTNISSNYLNEYFQLTQNYPTTILLIKPEYGNGNDKNPLDYSISTFLTDYSATEFAWCIRFDIKK